MLDSSARACVTLARSRAERQADDGAVPGRAAVLEPAAAELPRSRSGVARSGASTPLELALGKKLPGRRKKKEAAPTAPAIPPQYDV